MRDKSYSNEYKLLALVNITLKKIKKKICECDIYLENELTLDTYILLKASRVKVSRYPLADLQDDDVKALYNGLFCGVINDKFGKLFMRSLMRLSEQKRDAEYTKNILNDFGFKY